MDDPVHGGIYTSVEPVNNSIPKEYKLNHAYPNPFNPSTTIKFSIPQNEKVRLEVFDIRGKLVNSLIDSDYLNAGTYELKWNGNNNLGKTVASGVYIARLTTGNYIHSIKMNLIK